MECRYEKKDGLAGADSASDAGPPDFQDTTDSDRGGRRLAGVDDLRAGWRTPSVEMCRMDAPVSLALHSLSSTCNREGLFRLVRRPSTRSNASGQAGKKETASKS